MHEAKVGIFDDNKPIRIVLRGIVESESHQVVAEAASVQEAIEIIEGLSEGDIDVALVDGNLDGPRAGGADGELIASLLRERFSRMVIIGISGSDPIASAHMNINKANEGVQLGHIISDLPDNRSVQSTQIS